jgi:sedoheptulose-bisphosphatase
MASNTTPSPELKAHLEAALPQAERASLRDSLIPALLQTISGVARTLRASHHVSLAGTANTFGDDQLNVDVAAENLIRAALAECPSAVTASSEEDPVEVKVEHTTEGASQGKERYTVAFDPLDGSSIIAPNWTVGTIVGIWDGDSALHQSPRDKQVAAILGVCGPRTTAVVAIRIPGTSGTCFEISLDDEGISSSQLIRPEVKLVAAGEAYKGTRYFAPANLRSAAYTPRYMNLISHYIESNYTLRYCGGLVPDLVHALVKGHGVYVSPVTATHKAKLRRLFELCPIALILECAGGAAMDVESGEDVLERPLENTDERGGLVCGNKEEVDKVRQMLLGP